MPPNLPCHKEMKIISRLSKNFHIDHDRSYLQMHEALQMKLSANTTTLLISAYENSLYKRYICVKSRQITY